MDNVCDRAVITAGGCVMQLTRAVLTLQWEKAALGDNSCNLTLQSENPSAPGLQRA